MTGSLFNKQISHFLLDYDGLLVDSEKLYFESWCQLLTDQGIPVCKNYHEGKHEEEVYELVKPYLKKSMTLEEVSASKKRVFNQLVSQGTLQLTEGIKNFIEKLKTRAPMAIVSNSTIETVEAGLKSTGIAWYFQQLFCFRKGLKRKPDPQLYNLALKSLNLKNNSVIAFEDSVSGVLSARSAGIDTVCISANPQMEEYCLSKNLVYFKSAIDAGVNFS